MEPVGYAFLIEQFRLPALPLPVARVITDALPDRRLRDRGGELRTESDMRVTLGCRND
jgi:hypothetical protein